MLDLSNSWIKALPFAVIIASVLGSPHCVGMCGGFVLTAAQSRGGLVAYHLGRLIGYFGLGAVAGLLGKHAFHSPVFQFLPWLATLVLALGFIIAGIRVWKGSSLHLFQMPPKFFKLYQQRLGRGPLATGLLSAFLPCGWLHTFLLGALATGSTLKGGLYLAFFWIGTLPALTLFPVTASTLFKPLSLRLPRISALLLMGYGLFSVAIRLIPLSTHSSCH